NRFDRAVCSSAARARYTRAVRKRRTPRRSHSPGRPQQPPVRSFPTRRSSDLGLVARGRLRLSERATCMPCVEQKTLRSEEGFRRDRKSTRLNSSHLVISYAVFCLKKKRGWDKAVQGGTDGGRVELEFQGDRGS